MLRPMFGMGGSEILVILIVALLFLGPDKLPDAAKTISKGIRDIKKQSRVLQQQIENDEQIGGAIRDLKSALRGEEPPIRPSRSQAAQVRAAATRHDATPAEATAAAAAERRRPRRERSPAEAPSVDAARRPPARPTPDVRRPRTDDDDDLGRDDQARRAARSRRAQGRRRRPMAEAQAWLTRTPTTTIGRAGTRRGRARGRPHAVPLAPRASCATASATPRIFFIARVRRLLVLRRRDLRRGSRRRCSTSGTRRSSAPAARSCSAS